MFEMDTIITGDNAEVMAKFPPDCIDLTVTSPPYDNLRDYKGYSFDFELVARELFRVTKSGGVVVWVVGDATVNGSETGTSFRQALYFMQCGFRLHDTMIYQTDKQPLNSNRYEPKFEYMFVLSKGAPAVFNAITEPSRYFGSSKSSPVVYESDGTKKKWWGSGKIKERKVKGNIWYIPSGEGKTTTDNIDHPGMFPEALARDHILSWSNPGDLVLDPFFGGGTTGKMAKENSRRYIGIEISAEYVEIARKRITAANVPLFTVTA